MIVPAILVLVALVTIAVWLPLKLRQVDARTRRELLSEHKEED